MEIELKTELTEVFDSLGVQTREREDLVDFYISRLVQAKGIRDSILANIESLQIQLKEADDAVLRLEEGIGKVTITNV